MRRTIWTLLLALVVQLLAGSAWGLRAPQSGGAAPHCHEVVMQVDVTADVAADGTADATAGEAPPDPSHTLTTPGDSHHCCAVGLGAGIQAEPVPALHATPDSAPWRWVSLSPSPDLRPPI